MTTVRTPSPDDSARCMMLRKRSKRGETLTAEEMRFCERMFRQYPGWYTRGTAEVFNDTVPFGSQVKAREHK